MRVNWSLFSRQSDESGQFTTEEELQSQVWRKVVFLTGEEIATYAAENLSAFKRAEAAGYFLLNLDHAQIVFSQIIGERNKWVRQKAQHIVFIFYETLQKISGLGFFQTSFLSWRPLCLRALLHA